jgi:hypothetical protein
VLVTPVTSVFTSSRRKVGSMSVYDVGPQPNSSVFRRVR